MLNVSTVPGKTVSLALTPLSGDCDVNTRHPLLSTTRSTFSTKVTVTPLVAAGGICTEDAAGKAGAATTGLPVTVLCVVERTPLYPMLVAAMLPN